MAILPPLLEGALEREVINREHIPREREIGISLDSREDVRGMLFVGLPGEHKDGSEFALEALKKGAFGVAVSAKG